MSRLLPRWGNFGNESRRKRLELGIRPVQWRRWTSVEDELILVAHKGSRSQDGANRLGYREQTPQAEGKTIPTRHGYTRMMETPSDNLGVVCPVCGCKRMPTLYTRRRGPRTVRVRKCSACGRRLYGGSDYVEPCTRADTGGVNPFC